MMLIQSERRIARQFKKEDEWEEQGGCYSFEQRESREKGEEEAARPLNGG
jgi:hypothetical protein